MIEKKGTVGEWKVYQDTKPHASPFMGYKGISYTGSEIVDKDGRQITELRAGDKFFIRDCIFGHDEYTATPCHLTPPGHNNKVVLTAEGGRLAGIPEGRPKDGLMGVCDRKIVVGIEHDPERGWLAMGYSYSPFAPEDV